MDTSIVQPSAHTTDASTKPRGGLLAALRNPTTASSDSSAESEDDASDSDRDALAQPSRIELPQSKPEQLNSNSSPDLEEDDDELVAYDRIKKRLAASKAAAEAEIATSTGPQAHAAATTISSEDEDDIPVKKSTRRPIARPAHRNRQSQSPVATPRSRRSSPGLFVTPNASPEKSRAAAPVDSESDEASKKSQSAELQARVRRIRAERLARKQQEEEQAQRDGSKSSRQRIQQESGSDSDGESGRRLTQQAKPTRKAGKKAMELMARDQQRISRNMQLTHQAKTKKKYGLDQLFSRFAYNAPNSEKPVNDSLPTPDASSNLASSDAELNQAQETPPTSPPMQTEPTVTDTKESSRSESAANTTLSILDKGKGRAPEFQHLPPHSREQNVPVTVQNAQVESQKCDDLAMVELSDSEDELSVTQPTSRFPVFDQIPLLKQQEPPAALRLRYLAQLNASNEPRKTAKSMTKAQLDQLLARNSREQGRQERAEKLADLRRRGIYIETEEEREKNQIEIEDMVAQFEKQRQEDLKLAKTEREEAKKNGETLDELPSSDESDGDYVGSGEDNMNEVEDGLEEEEEDEVDIELSGSEDEEIEKDNESNALIATEADEASDSSEQQEDEDADMEDEISAAPARKRTTARPRNIVMDEEDESEIEATAPASSTQQPSQADDMAAFGFGNANVGLGLTQMFAGTMANMESGSQSQSAVAEPEQDSLDFLRNLPDTQPGANFSQVSDSMVPNSQSLMSPQKGSQVDFDNHFSLGISQLVETSPAFSRTQLDDLPEPTQDAGFSFSRSPAGIMPLPSTVDTVMMSIAESPTKQKKGKLQRRRRDAPVEVSDEEEPLDVEIVLSEEDDIQQPPKPRDVFAKLQKGARKQKAVDDFNKKTSLAKDAFMEQAEESEDEYAGLGGASDDDSGDEDEETKNMIEHGEVDVDERQIAAFYADKAKKEDEKNINELYKNVMNGGLRRRAGGRDGFDMSDSEDEEDMRLRKKRAEFQKMNKALLADERIGDIAKDQKKQAFFHTLADFADEDEYDFLEMPAQLGNMEPSQSQEDGDKEADAMEDVTIPDSQTADAATLSGVENPLKRKSPSASQKENRPPPNLRRTLASDNLTRKPITFADVQHSVSELLDDPRIIVPDSQYSDSEGEDESPMPAVASRKPIVDRLSLSRTSSISEAAADSGNLAFHAPSRNSTVPGFRVPSLIRQATSNLSASSESRKSSGAGTPSETVRRGGTGKSNIHAQAREAERRHLLDKKESKRKEALKKKVSAGRKAGMRSVLGDLAGGFE
ncbi:MRC1-like domain-containing protein [Phaeosphaeria sp. MPI-PUGE-AT-0046c]|nr:MRC1-like domain-containing protein [Phaeosphaeria sp. MPI-PUGE-AT-0046c]